MVNFFNDFKDKIIAGVAGLLVGIFGTTTTGIIKAYNYPKEDLKHEAIQEKKINNISKEITTFAKKKEMIKSDSIIIEAITEVGEDFKDYKEKEAKEILTSLSSIEGEMKVFRTLYLNRKVPDLTYKNNNSDNYKKSN